MADCENEHEDFVKLRQEDTLFDPEKAERLPSNTPWLVEGKTCYVNTLSKDVLGFIIERMLFLETLFSPSDFMLVCKLWQSVVLEKCNGFWKMQYKMRFRRENVDKMRPKSWYRLCKKRWKIRKNLNVNTIVIENCDNEECPVLFDSLTKIDGDSAMCKTCDSCIQNVPLHKRTKDMVKVAAQIGQTG